MPSLQHPMHSLHVRTHHQSSGGMGPHLAALIVHIPSLHLSHSTAPDRPCPQMAIFAATLCAGEIVGCVSSPGLAKAPHLPTLAVAWGLLLPCALVLTPLIPAPPVEQAALRILGDPDAASSDFAAGHRSALLLGAAVLHL